MKQKDKTTNGLICDLTTGLCSININLGAQDLKIEFNSVKDIQIIYFTDPICSACWAIEPSLRKLELEYSDHFSIDYKMGGLLRDWNYSGGGINKPADVANHWDEVSSYYQMPIDGDLWLEDPLDSSYPPSIAFKAAQIQDQAKAILFLRKMREFLFVQKKNISRWQNIADAALAVNLDVEKLKMDFETQAKEDFLADLHLTKEFGVRGFPSLFFVNKNGQTQVIYGIKGYNFFEGALSNLVGGLKKSSYDKSWQSLFSTFESLTVREFIELSQQPQDKAQGQLDFLTKEKKLKKISCKNGSIWQKTNLET